MYEYRRLTPQQRAELVQQRLSLGFPPHSPPHPMRDQPFYLLTAACYEHRHHMHSQSRRQQVLEALDELFTMNGMGIRAWVVLPNHYHLLVHVPDFDVLGSIFRRVHGPTSREWNLEDTTPGRKVWYRFTDRAIRSERHYHTSLNYIHYNPVKHRWGSGCVMCGPATLCATTGVDGMMSGALMNVDGAEAPTTNLSLAAGQLVIRPSTALADYALGWDDVESTDER